MTECYYCCCGCACECVSQGFVRCGHRWWKHCPTSRNTNPRNTTKTGTTGNSIPQVSYYTLYSVSPIHSPALGLPPLYVASCFVCHRFVGSGIPKIGPILIVFGYTNDIIEGRKLGFVGCWCGFSLLTNTSKMQIKSVQKSTMKRFKPTGFLVI